MNHQNYIIATNTETQNTGIRILYTNQNTMDRGGQICSNTIEDSIFSIPPLPLALNQKPLEKF